MTDQAFKDGPNTMGPPTPQTPGRSTLPTRFGDKVVSFTLPRIDGEKPKTEDFRTEEFRSEEFRGDEFRSEERAPDALPSAPTRDWSSAIDLIHEASEAIRISQERSVDLETQLEQVMAQATNEVQRLNAQIVAGEQKLAATEERLRNTEARALEAEGWLVRLHDAIFTAFTGPRPDADGVEPSTPVGDATD